LDLGLYNYTKYCILGLCQAQNRSSLPTLIGGVILWMSCHLGPDEVKQTLGFELRNVQNGERPSDSKPLKDVGKGVFELREEVEMFCIGLHICPDVVMK
jgi:hypothetical protein